MPAAVYLELDAIEGVEPLQMQLISPKACPLHAATGCDKECASCHDCKNLVAVTPFTNVAPWALEVKLDGGAIAKVKVRRRQLPLVCLAA